MGESASAAVGQDGMSVTFWGTRGSIACAGPDTVRYGGNTSCVEVMCGTTRLIFDGGTGLRQLGRRIFEEGPQNLNIYLTHTHLDHIIGLPFFLPLNIVGFETSIWAGHLLPDRTLLDTMCGMMQAPLFPVPPEHFRAQVEFRDFTSGETMEPAAGIRLRTTPLNHPNGACGYRVDFADKSVCYITDVEHYPDERDAALVEFVRNADVMIYDSTYTEEEYPRFVGFGHSTWEEGCRVADAAAVDTLVLYHHEPSHDDARMDVIDAAAREVRPGTITAREGLTLEI